MKKLLAIFFGLCLVACENRYATETETAARSQQCRVVSKGTVCKYIEDCEVGSPMDFVIVLDNKSFVKIDSVSFAQYPIGSTYQPCADYFVDGPN